ncbi:MAG TPA: cbb3-type cytochrome c oxidase subunit 3 [Steroidobacteraceae bacterium]|nr:cbb3-type cytochrome c oxidase subunit 3 [Steroidobacteraceae bacterium]
MNRSTPVMISVAIGTAILLALGLSAAFLILAGYHADTTVDATIIRMGPLVIAGDTPGVLARHVGSRVQLVTGLVTLALIVVFIAICAWAWSGRHKSEFDAAARLPLGDE